jgi:hypothetical protein
MTTMANNPYNGEKYIFENVLMPLQNTRDGVLQTVASFNQAVFDYGGQIKSAVSNSVTQAGLCAAQIQS